MVAVQEKKFQFLKSKVFWFVSIFLLIILIAGIILGKRQNIADIAKDELIVELEKKGISQKEALVSVWFDKEFQLKGENYHVVFLKLQKIVPVDDIENTEKMQDLRRKLDRPIKRVGFDMIEDCPGCQPIIPVNVYKNGNIFNLFKFDMQYTGAFNSLGSFGDVDEIRNSEIINLSKDHIAILARYKPKRVASEDFVGIMETGDLFEFKFDGLYHIGNLLLGMNNTKEKCAERECIVYNVQNSEIELVDSENPEYPDIYVRSKGFIKGGRSAIKNKYRYDMKNPHIRYRYTNGIYREAKISTM